MKKDSINLGLLGTLLTPEEKLAIDHWKWLKKTLEPIYIGAFVHGYKHALERKVRIRIRKKKE